MRVIVNLYRVVEMDVNEEIFEKLHEIHKDPNGFGEDEDYSEAEEIIINKLLSRCELRYGEEISGVYAEDDIPILEFWGKIVLSFLIKNSLKIFAKTYWQIAKNVI